MDPPPPISDYVILEWPLINLIKFCLVNWFDQFNQFAQSNQTQLVLFHLVLIIQDETFLPLETRILTRWNITWFYGFLIFETFSYLVVWITDNLYCWSKIKFLLIILISAKTLWSIHNKTSGISKTFSIEPFIYYEYLKKNNPGTMGGPQKEKKTDSW